MSEFVVQNVTIRGQDSVDIEIRDGTIDRIVPHGDGHVTAFDKDRRYDADGRFATASLTEPHTHLDAVLSAGRPRWNQSGTLAEGWSLWEELRHDITKAEIKQNAIRAIEWLAANGVTRVRTHVDTTYEELTGVEALIEVREEVQDIVDLQLVAFPVSGLFTTDGDVELFQDAIDMGLDLVGGIPHNEYTREDGVKEIETVVDIAEQTGLPLDLHIDETDDPQSRFTGILASEALKRGLGRRTTASHATAMHSYSNAYAAKLIGMLAESGMQVVTNPPINEVLQGRYDDYPRRRGHTRVRELRDAGVPVGIGQDDIMDPWYHYGDGDPLTAAFVLLHFAHMNGRDDIDPLWEMLVDANAELFGATDHGLEEGNEGSIVVYDSPDPFNTLRLRPPRTLVLKDGRPIAKTEPRETTVLRSEGSRVVDFQR
ncbi:amidohydrolase family protein [Salinigranum marinum]|uniref:amidohydrolase family protein n=1 Tax=Salinigranum marinum TaxID=1515595 RepID=UPI002989CBBB|nr:amidohydrolase family protein [Salinigranum marinum]